jgi:flagellar hook-associated protein 2
MPSIDGIVSGINTTALIDAVIAASAGPQRAMQAQRTDLEARRERVSALSTRLTTLSTALKKLDGADEWKVAKRTSADATGFISNVDNDATLGTYAIRVNQLATSQVTASGNYAERNTAGQIAHGTLNITVGSATTAITIDSTNDTLADLASALDEVEGISAFTVDTGDATNPWRLVVQADDSGTAGAFTLDTTGLTGGTGSAPTFTNPVTAVNATITVNGVSVTRSSNVFTDVVPGIDITARAETSAAETMTVEQDNAAVGDLMQEIVTAYNDAVNYYKQQSFFNSETGNRGPLNGEGTTRRAMTGLGTMLTTSYTVAGTTFQSLAELGFETQRDGTIVWDRTVFDDALDADPDAVSTFLSSADGPFQALVTEIDDVLVDSENGSLTNRAESLGESVESYDERIEDFQDYLDDYAQRLRDQFTNLELTLARLQSSQSALTSLFAGISANSGQS